LKVHNKISFTVKASSNTDRFGISFVRGTDSKSWYSIHVNADEGKANFEKDGDNAKYLFDNKFNIPADNEYRVTIYSDQDLCDLHQRPVIFHEPHLSNAEESVVTLLL